jgi:hypothetical protein
VYRTSPSAFHLPFQRMSHLVYYKTNTLFEERGQRLEVKQSCTHPEFDYKFDFLNSKYIKACKFMYSFRM